MSRLTADECRILGVLIEKAQTTPGQYPLSLNGVATGSNQKSNRDPVMNLSEDRIMAALDGLRAKNLVREVMLSGSRVQKFRHIARETMEVTTSELVVLAELLMRGPQTLGELRTRASRMYPLESMDIVKNVLESLMNRDEPMAREVSPAPGSRAARFAQLLNPDLHPIQRLEPGDRAAPAARECSDDLVTRVERLEREVASLRDAISGLTAALGEPGPSA